MMEKLIEKNSALGLHVNTWNTKILTTGLRWKFFHFCPSGLHDVRGAAAAAWFGVISWYISRFRMPVICSSPFGGSISHEVCFPQNVPGMWYHVECFVRAL